MLYKILRSSTSGWREVSLPPRVLIEIVVNLLIKFLAIAVVCSTTSSSLLAAIVVDFSDGSAGSGIDPNSQSLTGFNVGAGSDRLLIAAISTGTSVTSVTYNGQTLTKSVPLNTNPGADIWHLVLGSGASITSDIVIAGGSGNTHIGGVSLSGVDQSNPIDNPTFGTGTSLTVASEADDLVLDVFRGNGFLDALVNPITPDASQTELVVAPFASSIMGVSSEFSTGSTVAMDWNATSAGTPHIAVNINAASAVPEPSSLLFLVLGGVTCACTRRRSRRVKETVA